MEKKLKKKKETLINFHVNEDEKALIDSVAERRGTSISGLLRLLVVDEDRRLKKGE